MILGLGAHPLSEQLQGFSLASTTPSSGASFTYARATAGLAASAGFLPSVFLSAFFALTTFAGVGAGFSSGAGPGWGAVCGEPASTTVQVILGRGEQPLHTLSFGFSWAVLAIILG